RGHWANIVPRVAFQAGLMGDAGSFERILFGRTPAFPVVGLLFLVDGGDGEEPTLLMNLTSISSRIVAIGPVCFTVLLLDCHGDRADSVVALAAADFLGAP